LRPSTTWRSGKGTNPDGGWSVRSDGGRFGSPCLELQSGRDNYGNGGNILWLNPDSLFHDFSAGKKLYCAVLLETEHPGKAEFCLQTTEKPKFVNAYSKTIPLNPDHRWQFVEWRGEIARDEGFDFAQTGLYGYLIFWLPEGSLRIDSIEVGCEA